MSDERKVVKALSPAGENGRYTLAFASNTDIVYDKESGLMLDEILADLSKSVALLTKKFVKNIVSEDWSLDSSDNKYHLTITVDEHKLTGSLFSKMMIKDDDGNLTFNYGLIDGRDYHIVYKVNGDVEIISTTQFEGRLVISSCDGNYEVTFNMDSWYSSDGIAYEYNIPLTIHGVTNPVIAAVCIANGDGSYQSSHGHIDDIDYSVTIDNNGNIKILTTARFSGKIYIECS